MANQKQPFSDYKRKGKLLQGGFNWLRDRMQEEGRVLESNDWADVSMPEYLWFGLLRDALPEGKRYDVLRLLAADWPTKKGHQKIEALFAGHTFIANGLSGKARDDLLKKTVALAGANALRPLLLLERLPARSDWAKAIGAEPNDDDASILGALVQNMRDFHSDIATDACWMLYLIERKSGRMIEPGGELEQWAAKYQGPDEHAGFFRALELQYRGMMKTEWPAAFWEDVWLKWRSQPARADEVEVYLPPFWYDQLLPSYLGQLEKWYWQTRKGSADHVYELMFGLLLHSATIACEVIRFGRIIAPSESMP